MRPAAAPPCSTGSRRYSRCPTRSRSRPLPRRLRTKCARAASDVVRLRVLRWRHAGEPCRDPRFWSGWKAPPASRFSWAHPPATCWSTTMPRSIASLRGSRAAPPFMPRTRIGLKAACILREPGDPSIAPHLAGRRGGVDRDAAAGQAGRAAQQRVHVLHVSTADEMAFLKDHKDWATVEVTPHHLTLSAPECYERLGTTRR